MKRLPSGQKAGRKKQTGKQDILSYKNLSKKDTSPYYAIATLIIACFIFYGNTMSLKYAYDDLMVITGNQFTKHGLQGIRDILTTDYFSGFFGKGQNMVSGGRYRPLSLVTFAIEYQFFGENPLISHLINVLLYTSTCIFLFVLLRKFAFSGGYKENQGKWYLSAAFLITLLFAAHPVHTEVVANIKSRDEILSFLFCLTTVYFSIKFLDKRKAHLALFSGLCFFLALLSKENSLTFLAVLPLTLFFFTKYKAKDYLLAIIPLVFSAAFFLLLRRTVTGHSIAPLENDLMNNPFVEMTISQKYATILYTLGLYIKLLIFPHPLTSDYYPYHIPIINPGSWRAIIPFIVYALLIVWIILRIPRKNLPAFCFLYFLITLSIVSNIFFPIGVFMSERFLYMPSLAFCILLGSGFIWVLNRIQPDPRITRPIVTGLLILTLVLYAYKTISRNADWYDSYTLFTTDVKVSQNSAKGNEVAGEYIMQKALLVKNKATRDSLLRGSIAYQQKAIQIYPKQIIALFNLAAAYYEYNKDYDTILVVYKTILNYLPGNERIYSFFNSIMGKYGNVDHKIRLYQDLLQVNPQRFDVNLNLGFLYFSGKLDAVKALPLFEKAVKLNPADFNGQEYLGTAYGYLRRWNEARKHLELADSIKPGDPEVNKNLSIVYQNLGEHHKARQPVTKTEKGQ